MNIKTLSPSLTAVDRELKSAELKKSVKSENTSADRDPNGKRERDEGKDPEQKQFLTDEEIEKALETLKNFDGIKDSYLKVELVVNEISRHVLITDPQGKVVRRIPESELWPLIQPKESEKKGHLLDKAG